MKAGRLDQRITIERFERTQDTSGEPIYTWVPFMDTWAAVEPLTGREYIAADAGVSESTVRVRLRYRPGVTPEMRVSHGDVVYEITHVADVRSQGRELQLMCRRLA